jgi:uncharacterized RDD family membrane protein YckC
LWWRSISRGSIQGAAGLAFVSCDLSPTRPVLNPPPPDDYNFTLHCQRSLLGLDMANWLAIGKVVSTGNGFDKEHTQYALGPRFEQAPTAAPTIVGDEWIIIAFLLYLPIADWLYGATIGKRIAGLRTVAVGNPRHRGLPFWNAFLRFAAMHAGIVASTAIVLVYQLASADIEGSMKLSRWLYVLAGGWVLWNAGLLIAGWGSLYDQAAGTTVVRPDPRNHFG